MTELAVPPAARTRPDRSPVPLVLAWLLLGLGATAVAVALAGAAPQPVPAGLPDPGPVPGWSLPLVRAVGHAAVVALVAALLSALLAGRSTGSRVALVVPAALLWVATSLAALLLGLAEVVGRPVGDVLEPALLRFYVTEVPQGRAALLSALLALAVLLPPLRHTAGRLVALLLVGAALVPPLLAGHAASAGSHRAAQLTLVLHVLAAVVWVGGVVALALLPPDADLSRLARRFSPLALGCALLVAVSGVASAWLRVDVGTLLGSGYGALLLLKTAALLVLVGIGLWHRQRTLPAVAAGAPGALRRLAAAEVAVMAVALGLAAALARTPLG